MLKSIINIYKGNKENKNDNLSNYFISYSKKIQFLSSFFKEVYNNIITFKESLSKNINILKDNQNENDEQENFERTKTIDEAIQLFYNNTFTYLNKISEILEKFNELIIIPFNDFKKEYDNKSLLLINNLTSLKNTFNDERNNVIYYHNKYFLDVKEYLKIKRDITFKNNNNIIDDNEKKKNEELLNKIKTNIEIDKQAYEYQLDYFNYFYHNEFIKKYKKFNQELEKTDNDRTIFLRNIIYLYNLNLTNLNITLKDYITLINSIFKNIKNEKNKILTEYIDEFSKYENLKNNINNEYKMMNKEITTIKRNNQNNNLYFKSDHDFLNGYNENSINKVINNYKNNKNEYYIKVLNNYFEYINRQKQIPLKNICEINNLIFSYNDFYIAFIEECLKRYNISSYIKVNIIDNYNHLEFVLKSKILLYINNNILLSFLLLGQKIYFSDIKNNNENKKIFLCNAFNKIYLFKQYNFWDELFQLIMDGFFQKEDNSKEKEINDLIIKNDKYISFDELNVINESFGNDKKYKYKNIDSLISNNDIFNESIIKDNEENKNKIFINIHKALLFYILCLINYNYNIIKSKKLLIKKCSKLSLSNQAISFYSTYLNNYSYSTKNSSNPSYNSVIIKKQENNLLSRDEAKFIINKAIKYLDSKSIVKIMTLNKKYNKDMKNKIYKIILKQYVNKRNINKKKIINNKLYINIWKNILNFKYLRALYPYEEYKSKALKIKYNKNLNIDYTIIDADCYRTNFTKGQMIERRAMLNNILKTLFVIVEDTSYCQGMNYLVCFIILISENEEEAFYLSLGFLKYTPYKSLFTNDLKTLKLYFAIFDKLLHIYLPTIYSYLNSNKIYSDYYLSPLFITLFTNLLDEKLSIDPFIEIINLFIIHGWKSVFNIILNIFRLSENNIVNIKSENVLQFLTSEICLKFIKDIEENMKFYAINQIKVSRKLICEIENEFSQFLYLVNESNK